MREWVCHSRLPALFCQKAAGRRRPLTQAAAYRDTPAGANWGDPDNYYDQNWAWFATALANGK
jgi:hypothetical protein